jgi:selenium metabolism protein YedF
MKEYKLDARGLDCPKPLLRTKQVISDQKFDRLTVLVGNEPARENIMRFLKHMKFQDIHWETTGVEGEFSISSVPGLANQEDSVPETEKAEIPPIIPATGGGNTVLIASERIGMGKKDLGGLLMKGYIYTLTQIEIPPAYLIFMNTGVNLTLDDSESLEDLRVLEGRGVSLLVCGTCLDYLNAGDRLQIGQISNMYEIAERLHSNTGVLTFT